ncbi:MAG: hypothetical protein QXN16_02590 [Candidatus Micrarchaeaceae archaeon]
MYENISKHSMPNKEIHLRFNEDDYDKFNIEFAKNLLRTNTTYKILCERDEDGYTAHHDNKETNSQTHSTSRGDAHTTHNYDDGSGRYDLWPIGGNDKWISNDNKKD